jgi:N-acyl-L-homoserine lactone synthetase
MFYFKKAENYNEYNQLYRLRYQSYCLDNRWLDSRDYPSQKEKDLFDPYAVHFIATDLDKEVIGTARIVRSCDSPDGLPIEKHPSFEDKYLDTYRSLEISHIAVKKEFQYESMLLGFFRIIYQYSLKEKQHSWYTTVNPTFLKVINSLGFNFMQAGAPAEYFGDRTLPVRLELLGLESSLRRKNPSLYEWFMQDPFSMSNQKLFFIYLRCSSFSGAKDSYPSAVAI